MAKSTFETTPEKLVIIAGPTFCQALKFMTFGAALGAGAVYFLLKGEEAPSKTVSLKNVAHKYEAGVEDYTAAGTPVLDATHTGGSAEVVDRLSKLTSRLKVIGNRTKTLVESASEALKPSLESALAEGKKAAAEVQAALKKEVDEAGDSPAIAEQDAESPSEKEDKMVE